MKFLLRNTIRLTTVSLFLGCVAFGQAPASKSKASRNGSETAPPPGMVLPTPPKDSPVASSITGALDVGQAVDAIQTQGFDAREKVAAEIEQRLTSSWTRLEGYKAQLSGLTEEGKAQVNAALSDAAKRRSDLQATIAAARRANENSWDGVRPQLAAEYARYAETVARAEIGLTKTIPPVKDATKS